MRALQESLQAIRAQFDSAQSLLQERHAAELRAASRLRTELETTVQQLRTRLDERP